MSLHNNEKNHKSQSSKAQLGDTTGEVVLFWKNPGETLAVMLRRFREEHDLGPDEKLTYAGRLDPMAEGIVPILSGNARFRKDHMMGASKTYEVDILLGMSTDTGDMLGLIDKYLVVRSCLTKEINEALEMLRRTVSLPYPNYSSIPVDGKPLFMHARANNKVVLPIKKVTIYSLELLGIREVFLNSVLADAIKIVEKVQGDFRQEEILTQWSSFLAEPKRFAKDGAKAPAGEAKKIQIVTIRTTVSSGTYMRSLAEKMGKLLQVPALAYRIVRTNVET